MPTPSLTERQDALFRGSYREKERGDARWLILVDPFSGEPMNSRRPPASIERIPHLREGLGYLRSRADDMQVTLFASRHSDDVVHSPEELGPLLDAHDSYFLEGYGTRSDRRAIYHRAASEELSMADWHNYRSAPSAYTDRQLRALRGRDKPIFMPEIPQDGTEQDSAFLEYSMIMHKFWPYLFGDDPDMKRDLVLALAGSNTIREWYMLANMGAQIAEYESRTGRTLSSPLIWMGGGHARSMAEKAATLGLDFEAVLSRHDQERERGNDWLAQATAYVAIDGLLRVNHRQPLRPPEN